MTLKYPLSQKSIDEINKEFIESYNHKHWWYKLKTHDAIINHAQKFIEGIGDELQDESIEDYRLALKSEIVFTYFHISEALFSLMACRAADVPWLYMKHLRFSEICDFVREELVEGASKRNIAATFYPRTREYEWQNEDGELFDSVVFIREYLQRMGRRFLENDIYTEYKHGLRLMAARSGFQIASESDDIDETIARQGTTHVYLEEIEYDRDGNDVYHNLKKVTKSFDYDLYYRLSMINYHLIDHMFMVLQQQLRNDEGMMDILLFDGLEIDEAFEEDVKGKFTLKRPYPAGEKIYEIS